MNKEPENETTTPRVGNAENPAYTVNKPYHPVSGVWSGIATAGWLSTTPHEFQQTCYASRSFSSFNDGDLKNIELNLTMSYKAAGYWWSAGTDLDRSTDAAAQTTAPTLATSSDKTYTYKLVDSAIALTVGAATMSTLYSMTY